jgi:hypothetical protein
MVQTIPPANIEFSGWACSRRIMASAICPVWLGSGVKLLIFPMTEPSWVVQSFDEEGVVFSVAITQRWRLTWPTLRSREMTS